MPESPLVFFPLFYVVLAAAMALGAFRRWRAGSVHLWQFVLSLLLKLVPMVAFGYAFWYSHQTGDDVGGYLMYAVAAVSATVLGIAWVGFDLIGLGVWRKDAEVPLHDDAKPPRPKPKAKRR